MAAKRIVVFGPGPVFKGGLANYTLSLAKAFDALPNIETHIVSWTQQYPSIVPRDFKDRASKEDKLAGTQIRVHYLTNYNNPLSWAETVSRIKEINPDKVIIQWSVAIQGLPLSYIARRLKNETGIEVIFDLHFVIQKEQSAIDLLFSRMALKHATTYVVHALKTTHELAELFPKEKPYFITENGERSPHKDRRSVIKLYHPVYDMFKPKPEFDVEAEKQRLGLGKNVFLFFGFIRKYKGLHHCIEAFKLLAEKNKEVSLLVVGESFWQTLDNSKLSTRIKQGLFGIAKKMFLKKESDEKDYNPLALIEKYGLQDRVVVVNDFVPNEEVYRYFQVSDAILLFYEYATPSGVESMAYNFKMPVLATSVGHFPETIKHGYNGYLAKAEDQVDMAKQMEQFLQTPINRANVEETAKGFSWVNYAKAILNDSTN